MEQRQLQQFPFFHGLSNSASTSSYYACTTNEITLNYRPSFNYFSTHFSFDVANCCDESGSWMFHLLGFEFELNFNFPFHVTHNIWLFHREMKKLIWSTSTWNHVWMKKFAIFTFISRQWRVMSAAETIAKNFFHFFTFHPIHLEIEYDDLSLNLAAQIVPQER